MDRRQYIRQPLGPFLAHDVSAFVEQLGPTIDMIWVGRVLPLAYLIPKYSDLGVYGVRWAIVTSIVMRGVIYSIYFKGGWWKDRKI